MHTSSTRQSVRGVAGAEGGQGVLAKNETLALLEAGLRAVRTHSSNTTLDKCLDGSEFSAICMSTSPPTSGMSSSSLPSVARQQAPPPSVDDEVPFPQPMGLIPQFFFAVLLGTLVGLVTVLFQFTTMKVSEYHRRGARALTRWSSGPPEAGGAGRAGLGAYMAIGTALSALLVSWATQRFMPECVGGGTVATKICLAVGSPVPLRVGLWRFLLSAAYVGSGNLLGIEAPTLHLSAATASALHTVACSGTRCISARTHMSLFTPEGLPQAVVLGCAAGLSAAFGSPLAAISYAVEEYVDVRQTGIVTALVLLSSLSAALVRWGAEPHTGAGFLDIAPEAINATTLASETVLGVGGHAALDRTSSASTGILPWLLVATVIGVGMGTLSPALMTVVLFVRRLCNQQQTACFDIIAGAMAGLLGGGLSCAAYLLTGCESAWGLKLGVQLYHDVTCDAARRGGLGVWEDVWVTLLLSATKLISFGACFAVGGAGGVLMPSLVVGAMLGHCAGLVAAPLDPALPHAGVVLGMAAFFSANMRLPLTAAGVALEYATASTAEGYDARLACTIPLASALGTWVASWWDPFAVFERMMMQDGINPFTLSHQIQVMIHGPQECQGRRDSIGSVASSIRAVSHGPLSPPARTADGAYFGESRASTHVFMAARRRSILAEFQTDPSRFPSAIHSSMPSFISSPDELLFASKSRMKPHGTRNRIQPEPVLEATRRTTIHHPGARLLCNQDSRESQTSGGLEGGGYRRSRSLSGGSTGHEPQSNKSSFIFEGTSDSSSMTRPKFLSPAAAEGHMPAGPSSRYSAASGEVPAPRLVGCSHLGRKRAQAAGQHPSDPGAP